MQYSIQCVTLQLQSLHRQHKEYQQFKQLIKRQSKLLNNYILDAEEIGKEFQSQLFKVFLDFLNEFQKQLSQQYVVLKQQGQQFYLVKEETQQFIKSSSKSMKECQKRMEKVQTQMAKLSDQKQFVQSNQFKLDQTALKSKLNEIMLRQNEELKQKQQTFDDTQLFWQKRNETILQRLTNQQQLGQNLIVSTNKIIQDFCQKHHFYKIQSQNNSAQKTQQTNYQKQYETNKSYTRKSRMTKQIATFPEQTVFSQCYAESFNDREEWTVSEQQALQQDI